MRILRKSLPGMAGSRELHVSDAMPEPECQRIASALQDERIRKQMLDAGLDPTYVGQNAFVERIRAEAARYSEIIRRTGIKVDR